METSDKELVSSHSPIVLIPAGYQIFQQPPPHRRFTPYRAGVLWRDHGQAIDPGKILVITYQIIDCVMRTTGSVKGIREEQAVLPRHGESLIENRGCFQHSQTIIVKDLFGNREGK